jgi:uridine kinase
MNLIEALHDLTKSLPSPIITIDGPAGAGKTTLADHIARSFDSKISTSVIHMDDLYNGWTDPFGKPFLEALDAITKAHLAGKACEIQKYDWYKSEYGPSITHSPTQLLVLEGVGSSTSHIRECVSVSIWIDIKPEDGLQRVLTRDGTSIENEMHQWLTTQEAFFTLEQSAELADFALTT